MKIAMQGRRGRMISIIGREVRPTEIFAISGGLNIDVACINSLNEIVVSGLESHMLELEKRIESGNGNRTYRVRVHAADIPFHSAILEAAAFGLKSHIEQAVSRDGATRATNVLSNHSGIFYSGNIQSIVDNLSSHLYTTVNWINNARLIDESGCELVCEVGPSRLFRNSFKKPGITFRFINGFNDICALSKKVGGLQPGLNP